MSGAINLSAVGPGFEHPALESQRIYRRLLDAMARPGRLQDLSEAPAPPAGLLRPSAGIALTLFDFETRVWLDPALRGGDSEAWLRFHCSCPLTDEASIAAFALVVDATGMPPLDAFDCGDVRYPDRSTTLVVQLPSLVDGTVIHLGGPGIDGRTQVAPAGLPENFWEQIEANHANFQLGVDLFLVDHERVLGLPRSARRVEADAACSPGPSAH